MQSKTALRIRHTLPVAALLCVAAYALLRPADSPMSLFRGEAVTIEPPQAAQGIIIEPGEQVLVVCPTTSNQSPILGSEGFDGTSGIKVAVQRQAIAGVSDPLYFLSESYLLARPQYRAISTLVVFEVAREYSIIADKRVGFRCGTGLYVPDADASHGAAGRHSAVATVRTGAVQTSALRKRGEGGATHSAAPQQKFIRCQDLPAGLTPAPEEYFDWFGKKEKWLRDDAKKWYYIERDGSVYALADDGVSGIALGRVDLAYYNNIRLFAGCLNPADGSIAPTDASADSDGSDDAFVSIGTSSSKPASAFAQAMPETVAPSGSTGVDQVRFEWVPLADAVRYEVSVLDGDIVRSEVTPETFLTPPVGWSFVAGATYKWYVRGFDASGASSRSSDPVAFTVESDDDTQVDHSAAPHRISFKKAFGKGGIVTIEYAVEGLKDADIVQVDLSRKGTASLTPDVQGKVKQLESGALRFSFTKNTMEFSDPIRRAGSTSFSWDAGRFGDISSLTVRLLESDAQGAYVTADQVTFDGVQCGDGIVSASELCDDANTDGGDYCGKDCSLIIGSCGDGLVQESMGESCDDGNDADGDGCGADCRMSDFSCDALLCENPREASIDLPVTKDASKTVIEAGAVPYYIGTTSVLELSFTVESSGGDVQTVAVSPVLPASREVTRDKLRGAVVAYSVECGASDDMLKTCKLFAMVDNGSAFRTAQAEASFGIEAEETDAVTVSGIELTVRGCSCLTPLCGDGTKDWYEQCDDGNTRSGDECGPVCTED